MSLGTIDFGATLSRLPWAPCSIDLAPARWTAVRGRIYHVAHADHRQRLASLAHEHTMDLPIHGGGLRVCAYMGRLGVRGARLHERPVVLFLWLMRQGAGGGWIDWPYQEPRVDLERALLCIAERGCEYHAQSLIVQGPVLSCYFRPALAGGAS